MKAVLPAQTAHHDWIHSRYDENTRVISGALAVGSLFMATTILALPALLLLNSNGISRKVLQIAYEGKTLKEVHQDFRKLPLYGKVAVIGTTVLAAAFLGLGLFLNITLPFTGAHIVHVVLSGTFGAIMGGATAFSGRTHGFREW